MLLDESLVSIEVAILLFDEVLLLRVMQLNTQRTWDLDRDPWEAADSRVGHWSSISKRFHINRVKIKSNHF